MSHAKFSTLDWSKDRKPYCCCKIRFPDKKYSRFTECPIHGKVASSRYRNDIKPKELTDC